MIKKAPRVLLLVDWIPERGSLLLESLRKTGLNCDIMGTDFHQSRWTPLNKIISHWPRCLLVSLKAFCCRHDYDYIIAWQQTMGMFLGLIKLMMFSNSPKVFILTAIIVERQNRLLEWLRRKFISLSWKKVNHIGFLSNAYMRLIQERFNLKESQSVLLKSPIIIEKIPNYSGYIAGSYLYSVGRSYRDYQTLMAAAQKSTHQFVVVTSDDAIKGLMIPDNVTVYRNIFGEESDRLMQQASAVIIPLSRVNSPSGELTLMEAMCYGKPVIITQTVITQEYVVHGQNGYLVPWQDANAIVEAINTIFSDPEKADAIGCMARKNVLENHVIDVFSYSIANIINKNHNGISPIGW